MWHIEILIEHYKNNNAHLLINNKESGLVQRPDSLLIMYGSILLTVVLEGFHYLDGWEGDGSIAILLVLSPCEFLAVEESHPPETCCAVVVELRHHVFSILDALAEILLGVDGSELTIYIRYAEVVEAAVDTESDGIDLFFTLLLPHIYVPFTIVVTEIVWVV